MPEARVESIESLKSLKSAMIKFGEEASLAISDAESDIVRTMNWLETEQSSYWKMQHRKRTELVSRCKEALRMKQIFKDSSGRQQSAVEEQKALKIAMQKMEEADFKIKAVRRAIMRLEREIQLYKGSVQRFATDVQVEVPAAAAHLQGLLTSLEAYVGFGVPTEVTSSAVIPSTSEAISAPTTGSMARSVDEQKKDEEQTEPEASAPKSEPEAPKE